MSLDSSRNCLHAEWLGSRQLNQTTSAYRQSCKCSVKASTSTALSELTRPSAQISLPVRAVMAWVDPSWQSHTATNPMFDALLVQDQYISILVTKFSVKFLV